MAVLLTCRCGASYDLKDEFAGKAVKCPKCGETVQAPAATVAREGLDPAFNRNKFLLRQKHMAVVSEKYYVWDDKGKPILYVERPYHHMRSIAAALAGIFAGGIVAAVFGLGAATIEIPAVQIALGILAAVGFFVALIVVATIIVKKRDVTFFRDDTKAEALLEILQDRKINIITAPYTVRDMEGQVLARLSKNNIYDIFRKRWYCHKPDGELLCLIKEDSLILSLLRRFLGPLFGFLRTNFVILRVSDGQVIGEFNRKFTLLDRYVLDMSADVTNTIDRRIAVAIGLMLDTGERR